VTDLKPLTPPDCDLQDFPFMPLHVARLRDSDLAAEEAPEACWYAVLLWAASWHQIPAGSLPDNDAVLTKLIGLGRDVKTFRKHKAGAMRGFVLCDDGRLYHPIVAEQALTAWQSKLQQRWRTECARIKKANQRNETNEPMPTFEAFLAALPAGSRPSIVPGDDAECPEGQAEMSPGTAPPCPEGNVVQETGTGTGIIDSPQPPEGADQQLDLTGEPLAKPDEVQIAFDLWNDTAKRSGLPRAKILDEPRRRAIKARLKAAGLDGWREAMTAVQASAFLRGQRPGSDGRTFRADLSFVCQAKSFARLIEGGYGADAKPTAELIAEGPTSPPDPNDHWRSRMREFRRNGYWNTYDDGPKPGREGCRCPAEVLAEFADQPSEQAA